MRRRFNAKGLLALLGGVVVFALGTHFLHAYQVKRHAGTLIKQAERAEQAKQYRGAINYLRLYLGFRPEDTDALAHYGRLVAREDMATNRRSRMFAVLILDSVLRRDPTRDEERRLLINLGLRLDRYNDVLYQIEYLLGLKKGEDAEKQLARALKEDPKKGELVGKLAECHEAQRSFLQARKFYELAVRILPDEPANYVGLARVLREHTAEVILITKDPKTRKIISRETPAALHQQADELFDRLVKANPGASRSYVARAQYRRRYPLPAGREATLEAMERDLRQALQLAPDDADVLLSLAEVAVDQNRTSQAREFLLRGLVKDRHDWRMYQALSRLERGLNRSKEALSHLQEGLNELPDRFELLWEHADLLVAIGSGEAQKAIKQLKSKGVAQDELDVLSARLLIRERKWAEAVELLVNAYAHLSGRENRERSPFLAALVEQCNLLLTQCYEGRGDPYRAQNIYLRLLANNPRSLEIRQGLARTQLALGQVRDAENQYRQMANLSNGRSALIDVARLVLQRNLRKDDPDWDEINDSLQMAERLQPRPVTVALLRGEALSRQAEQESDKSKQEKLKEEARSVLVVNLLGGMPICTGLLRPEMLPLAALPQERSLAALWVAVSVHEQRSGRAEAALRLLDEADGRFGHLVELRQARMRYWARQKGAEAVKALAELESGLGKLPPEDRRQIQTTLAQAYMNMGQTDRARQVWQVLAEDHPDDWTVRLILFDQALEKNDDSAMDALLEQLRQIEKADGVLWRDAKLQRLLAKATQGDRSVLPEARQLVAEIATRWPGWVGVTQFDAQIEDLEGFPDKALSKYRAAIDKGAASVQTVWRAMEILNSQQRFREASALRAKLPRQGQFSAGLEHAAALASFRANDNAEALVRAERAAAKAPEDYRPQLLLGQIYWSIGELDRALSALRKARDLGDRAPETWVTLIGFLSMTERKNQAASELSKAEKKLTDLRGKLALAQCYEIVGENDKAGKLYATPQFAESPKFPIRRAVAEHYLRTGKFDAAQKHLNYLVKTAETKDPATVIWARGMLAILAALGGNYKEFKGAEARLEQSGSRDSAAGADGRRTQAAGLATQGNRSDRIKAIALLQGLIDEGRDQPPDRLLLAQLHEANNDWPKARQQLTALLKMAGGDTPASVIYYVSALLRHGEVEEAARALNQLEKVPAAAATLAFVSLKAQVWHRQGKEKEAVNLLIEHATKRGQVFSQVAVILEELKEYKAAEQMYKMQGEKSPNPAALVAFAGFLGRQKRYDEALDVCERAWGKAPAGAIANTCLHLVEATEDNKRVQNRVESQFQAALKKDPRSILLRLSIANLRVLQRQYEAAEQIYRELIREGPGNVLARNNLAWLLACQKKRIPDALTLMEEAIARAGPQATLLDTEALVFLEAGKVQEAVKILEALVVEAPQQPSYYFHLAQAHSANRNRQDAKRALLKAHSLGLKENTLHPLERQAFAQLLRDLGIPKNALAQE
jgi:predicted Zn-dependent protease